MTRISTRTRLGLACAAALLTLLTSAAAPAAAAPTKLWYRVTVSYEWTEIYQSVHHRLGLSTRATTEIRWKAASPRGADEAPLVRRDRETGDLGFGGANITGHVTRSDWEFTGHWEPPPPPAGLMGPDCSPKLVVHTERLDGKAELYGSVRLADSGFAAYVDARPKGHFQDDTGTITCSNCPYRHPFTSGPGISTGYPSCRWDPEKPFDATRPFRGYPSSDFQEMIRAGHDYKTRGRFGGKSVRVSSESTAVRRHPGGSPSDPTEDSHFAREKVSFTFSRCPGAGRKPC